MEEEISSELRTKIHNNVDKVFDKWLERASKDESIEGIIKSLMVEKVRGILVAKSFSEKVMNVLGALIKRTIVKKVAKRAVKKAVNRYWEKNRADIQEKIKNL